MAVGAAASLLGAVIACLVAQFPWWIRIAAGAVFLGTGGRAFLSVVLLRGSGAIRSLAWDPDGRWWLTDAGGKTIAAELSSPSAAFGNLLMLHFRGCGGGHSRGDGLHRVCVLDGRALDASRFRALRRRLRLVSGASSGTAC